jgi:hypothetical protein
MRSIALLVTVLSLGTAAAAHHSFAAYYHEEQSVTIEGVLVEFELKAPHAWIYVLAPDAAGKLQRYAAEWSNPTRLARDGIDRNTLRAGDRLTVTGSPGRVAAEYKIHLKRMTRQADGWSWRGSRR